MFFIHEPRDRRREPLQDPQPAALRDWQRVQQRNPQRNQQGDRHSLRRASLLFSLCFIVFTASLFIGPVGTFGLAGIGVTVHAATAADAVDVPLIPRQVLFGDPHRAGVQMSPDGAYISFLAPLDGVMNVWVAPLDDPDAARAVTFDHGRGIQGYTWTYLQSTLIYIQDTDGDENWLAFSVDVSTNESRLLTPAGGVQAQIMGASRDHPAEILVGLNDRIPQLHDLYLVNLVTGERELIYENEGLLGFILDDDYNIHFGIAPTPDGGMVILAATDDGWEPFATISMEDALTTGPAGFDEENNVLYMIDSRGRDTAALTMHDLNTGDVTVLFEDPRADVSHVMGHPTERKVQAVASTHARRTWQIIDPAIEADLAYLDGVADGELNVVARTLDDNTWTVAYVVDDGPVRYYRYDRTQRQATFLFTNRPALEGAVLAPMHSVIIPARDGLELVSYLTLPVATMTAETDSHEAAVTNDGDDPGAVSDSGAMGNGANGGSATLVPVPNAPLPLVLEVHGGPWARDEWGYNSVHQWLANRGYAVLSVNFRGSTGFGKAFINAGNKEWGARMHDDLIDAVQWAIDEGIADPDKICISGGSYGGYAALVGLTFTPDVFACGVSVVGPSNLVTLLEAIPPYWEPQVEHFATRVGDHRTEDGREFLVSRSPLTYVESIERSLLIGQGANDPRVKQAESDQIVTAMQAAGIPVTYVMYADEGHGFARPENRISFLALQEAFLHQHLGGRFEPIGDDFVGSTIDVQAGAEEIRGLDGLTSTGND